MKLSIFVILLISLSACKEDCVVKPKNNNNSSKNSENSDNPPPADPPALTQEQFVLANQPKLEKFLGNLPELNTAFEVLKNSTDENEKQQALADVKKAINNYRLPGYLEQFPALHTAAESGKVEILEILLKSGADINLKNSVGDTVLHFIAAHGDAFAKDVVDLLIKNGADINLKNNNNQTALDIASRDDVKALLQAKVKNNNNSSKNTGAVNNADTGDEADPVDNTGAVNNADTGDEADPDNTGAVNNADPGNVADPVDNTDAANNADPGNVADPVNNSAQAGFSAEEIQKYRKILENPDTKEFMDLLKSSSNFKIYLNSLKDKDSDEFVAIANIAKQKTDDALAIIDFLINAKNKTALIKVLENIDENLEAINENNFNTLFYFISDENLDENLIYKNIRLSNTLLIGNIIKKQANTKTLKSLLDRYKSIVDSDILNAFINKPLKENLLEIVYEKADKNNIQYDMLNPSIAKILLSLKKISTSGKKDMPFIRDSDPNKAKLLKKLDEKTRAQMLADELFNKIKLAETIAIRVDNQKDAQKKVENQNKFLTQNIVAITNEQFNNLITQYNNPTKSTVCKHLKDKNFASTSETLNLKYNQILGWLGCAN